jgi:hypothetical protein
MLIAARSFLDFGAKRGALMAPGDGEVILQRILISLVFFAIFGNDPRIVTRISRAAATIRRGVSWEPLVSYLVVSDPVA